MLRFLTAGESHGPSLVVIVEGLPSGVPVTLEQLSVDLGRRRLGYGRGPRMRFEQDELVIHAGVRHGRTLGSPVAIEIKNSEWPKWTEEMSAAPGGPSQILTQPRPGHVDLVGMQKYGFADARDVLERASARETAARTVVGSLAKALLAPLGVEIVSHVLQIGSVRTTSTQRPLPADLARVDESEVRCFDADAEARMIAEIKAAMKEGDSLGGVAEVLAYNVPVGLGSHVHWDRKIDGLIAQAMMSIHAVKGVEIGDGFALAGQRGSVAHDPIYWDAEAGAYVRTTTHAGGTEGGITMGGMLVARVGMKPLATLPRPSLHTVDMVTKQDALSFRERTDATAVPAMGVVCEAMMAIVVASEAINKYGGDSLAEFVRNHDAAIAALHETPSAVELRPSDFVGNESSEPPSA